MRTINLILILLFTVESFYSQSALLQSGPMVGYSTMREVMLWLQTTEAAKVKIEYWNKDDKSNIVNTTLEIITSKDRAFTAHLAADNVEPGIKYEYRVLINGKEVKRPYKLEFESQKLWQWREDPPEIKFAFGSCFYVNETVYDRPGEPYGGDYQVLDHLYKQTPQFMVWMGDNIYLREADWSAKSSIWKRYTYNRSLPGLQKLLGSTHHYATWDDHDFGPNNSDRSLWNKDVTLDAFKLFWANPSYGVDGKPGVTTYFQWGDLDFYLLDDRYHRSPERRLKTDREILGEHQVEWLIDALTSSWAPFKFVVIGTQFLNENAGGENHSMYPEERQKVLDLIENENIRGVVFLTGDIHRSEVTKLEREGTYPLYEFTVSPLTAGPTSRVWPNPGRIEESLLVDRNFGIIEVTGPRKDRQLSFTIIDKNGKVHYNLKLNENELK